MKKLFIVMTGLFFAIGTSAYCSEKEEDYKEVPAPLFSSEELGKMTFTIPGQKNTTPVASLLGKSLTVAQAEQLFKTMDSLKIEQPLPTEYNRGNIVLLRNYHRGTLLNYPWGIILGKLCYANKEQTKFMEVDPKYPSYHTQYSTTESHPYWTALSIAALVGHVQ